MGCLLLTHTNHKHPPAGMLPARGHHPAPQARLHHHHQHLHLTLTLQLQGRHLRLGWRPCLRNMHAPHGGRTHTLHSATPAECCSVHNCSLYPHSKWQQAQVRSAALTACHLGGLALRAASCCCRCIASTAAANCCTTCCCCRRCCSACSCHCSCLSILRLVLLLRQVAFAQCEVDEPKHVLVHVPVDRQHCGTAQDRETFTGASSHVGNTQQAACSQASHQGGLPWISTDTCHAVMSHRHARLQLPASQSDTHLGHSTKRRSCSCCTRCSIRRACVSCQLLSRCCSGADGTSRLSKGYSLHTNTHTHTTATAAQQQRLGIPAACLSHVCVSCSRCKQQGEQHTGSTPT